MQASDIGVGAGRLLTFLIADVRGYTRYTVEHGDEAAAALAARFAETARETVAAADGQVIELRGDEALAVFSSARQALRAAIHLQSNFAEERSNLPEVPLHVGVGLDAGEAIPFEGGFRGGALNLAARLCALAGPGEVLASEGVIHLARAVKELRYVERGAVQFKGFTDPVRVVEIREQREKQPSGPENDLHDVRSERPVPIGGFLGALPAGVLVGREHELDRLLQAIDVVAGGSGRLVLLAGEPGVGKTRLAQEATISLRNRRFQVAAGRCYEPRQNTAFYPFVEALAALHAGAPASIQTAVSTRWPYLGRLLPQTMAGTTDPPSIAHQDEHERLLWAVTGFIQALAAESPVAVLLDDLHWADSSSLELLQQLARHTRADRVLVLGTYRDIEVRRKHPLEQALRDLNREGLVERIPVRRMSRDETAALLASSFDRETVSDDFVSLMHRQTEGNPFYVHEVLRALVDRGDVYLDNGRWERRDISQLSVPESVRSAIGERLSRLSDLAQDVLTQVSVLGQTFDFAQLQNLVGRDEADVESVLEEASAAGLVAEVGRDQYGFNHALTQQALYEELPSRRRRRLHLAAGESLDALGQERRRGRAAEIAWHFLEADDDARALPYAILAGDQAAGVFALIEAQQHFRTALELMSETGDSSAQAEVQEKLGTVLVKSSEYNEAIDRLSRASEMLTGADDWEGVARVEVQIAQAHFGRQSNDEGLSRLERRNEELSGRIPSLQLARLYDQQAQLLFGAGRYEDYLHAAQRLYALTQSVGDDEMRMTAEGRLSMGLFLVGRTDEARRLIEEAVPRSATTGNLDASWLLLVNAGELYETDGSLETALECRRKALEVAERLGDQGIISFSICNVVQTEILLGRWEPARQNAERSLYLTGHRSSWFSPYPLLQIAEILYLQGDLDEAASWIERVAGMVSNSTDIQAARFTRRMGALVNIARERPSSAIDELVPVLDRTGSAEPPVNGLLPLLAEAQLMTGSMDAALETAETAARRSRLHGDNVSLVHALRVQGMVLTHLDRPEEARSLLEGSATLARGMPYPYAEALALFERGASFGRTGDRDAARASVSEAHDVFSHLGSKRYVRLCDARLRDLN
ncbi:MAG: helix-turn-helix transcriptional regulator [Chloroflexota bacterium]